jgi:hypothetical protein
VWYKTLKAVFTEQGFRVAFADQSILSLEHDKAKTFALIYVDDQIITGPNQKLNTTIKHLILKKFPGKDLGEAQFFVGVRLQRDFKR